MTLKHSNVQSRLSRAWGNYIVTSGQGGEVYTEASCQTTKQGCKPDVAYLTSELVQQFGDLPALPQSFPLVAEVVSPTDSAVELLDKAQEYLQSGGQEVWLVFPENLRIWVLTPMQELWFTERDQVSTQAVLEGFTIWVKELLA